MTTNQQKQEILKSLNNLDAVQSEKVLDFIKELLNNRYGEVRDPRMKYRAMKEIGQALKQVRDSF